MKNKNEGIVQISIERFKQLEKIESAALSDDSIIVTFKSYYIDDAIIHVYKSNSHELNDLMWQFEKSHNNEVNDLKTRIEDLKKQLKESETPKSSFFGKKEQITPMKRKWWRFW